MGPVWFGYKAYTLASSHGYVFNLDIYSVKSTEPNSSKHEDFGLCRGIVLNLLSVIGNFANHAIFFDNFFTPFYLSPHLKNSDLSAIGTIWDNCIQMCPLELVKCVLRNRKGYYDYQYEEKYNNCCPMERQLSNDSCFNILKNTSYKNICRYLKMQKKKGFAPQPHPIEQYNTRIERNYFMRQLLAKIRGKYWWWQIYTNYVDVTMTTENIKIVSSKWKVSVIFKTWSCTASFVNIFLKEELVKKRSVPGRPSKRSIQI